MLKGWIDMVPRLIYYRNEGERVGKISKKQKKVKDILVTNARVALIICVHSSPCNWKV